MIIIKQQDVVGISTNDDDDSTYRTHYTTVDLTNGQCIYVDNAWTIILNSVGDILIEQ